MADGPNLTEILEAQQSYRVTALLSEPSGDTTVLAVRPYLGMPAKDWIAADPEFWKPNPMAGR